MAINHRNGRPLRPAPLDHDEPAITIAPMSVVSFQYYGRNGLDPVFGCYHVIDGSGSQPELFRAVACNDGTLDIYDASDYPAAASRIDRIVELVETYHRMLSEVPR